MLEPADNAAREGLGCLVSTYTNGEASFKFAVSLNAGFVYVPTLMRGIVPLGICPMGRFFIRFEGSFSELAHRQ